MQTGKWFQSQNHLYVLVSFRSQAIIVEQFSGNDDQKNVTEKKIPTKPVKNNEWRVNNENYGLSTLFIILRCHSALATSKRHICMNTNE